MNTLAFFFAHNLPWLWLGIMVLCILIETMTMALTTIWFACGAFILVFVSMLPIPFRWQSLIFVVISCVLLILTRPLVLKKIQDKKKSKTNIDSLIGKTAPVTKDVGRYTKGEVKINGLYWAAIGENGEEIPAGTECEIVSIQGNTVTIKVKA